MAQRGSKGLHANIIAYSCKQIEKEEYVAMEPDYYHADFVGKESCAKCRKDAARGDRTGRTDKKGKHRNLSKNRKGHHVDYLLFT